MRDGVLVVGDLNADLILTGLSARPVYGKEVVVRDCTLTLGGSGAIFATGLGRLGRGTRFVGKIGRDSTGDMVLGMMARRGVDVSGVRRDPRIGTGIAVVLSEKTDRAIVSYLGTVDRTSLRELRIDRRGCRHLHLTSPFLQEGLRPDFPGMLHRARMNGLTTSIDPGWDPQEKFDLDAIYRWTDILFVNEVESRAITGLSDPKRAALRLAERVTIAVVKVGPAGAYGATQSRVWHAPAPRVTVVDTTGAGDSFGAGFMDAFLRGKPLEEALAFGCVCGALSTLRAGGYEGQATRAAALKVLRRMR